jgi:hypothetical protein
LEGARGRIIEDSTTKHNPLFQRIFYRRRIRASIGITRNPQNPVNTESLAYFFPY